MQTLSSLRNPRCDEKQITLSIQKLKSGFLSCDRITAADRRFPGLLSRPATRRSKNDKYHRDLEVIHREKGVGVAKVVSIDIAGWLGVQSVYLAST